MSTENKLKNYDVAPIHRKEETFWKKMVELD